MLLHKVRLRISDERAGGMMQNKKKKGASHKSVYMFMNLSALND